MQDKSEKRVREILHSFVDDISIKFEAEIEALILVGSLSNGSYVEGPGRDIVEELPVPTREELIFFDKLGREWSKIELSKNPGIREILNEPPINILVQIIFIDAFRYYFYSTNKSCSNKHEIAFRMRQDVPNYRFQRALSIATKYKMNPNEELPLGEYDELKKEYEELIKWRGPLPVDEVPLF